MAEKAPTTDELVAMKKKLDAAKLAQAQLEGQLADRVKRLEALGYKTTEAADAEIARLRERIADLDDRKARGIGELHREYGL